jgi:hypothetical protein
MKSTEDLQQDYQNYLDYLRCGRYGFTYEELDQHSVEELETLANFGWSDDVSEELYEIFMLRRKRKLNQQFVFNQETIRAIVDLNKELTDNCRKLKKEAESLFLQMQEQKRENFRLNGQINFNGNNEIIDCGLSCMNNNLLSFGIDSRDGIEGLNIWSIFNFDRNYADKVLSYHTQRAIVNLDKLADCHIGFAFFYLYRKSCLSLQDMLEIQGLQREINIRYYSDDEKI